MKPFAFLPFVWALCLPTWASAQLPRSTESLRGTLHALSEVVDDRVEKDEGRKDVQHAIDRTRDYLERLRDLSARGATRRAMASSFEGAGESFQEAMRELGRRDSRRITELVYQARGQWGAVALDWRNYPPVYVPRPPGFAEPPRLGNRLDQQARDLTLRYLAEHYLVPASVVQITRLEQTGNKYRVFAQVPRQGTYVVSLDVERGVVYSATPGR